MTILVNGVSSDAKIDILSVDGLSGVNNSLAYKVHEIEKHFHNDEQWFGKDGGDTYLSRSSITPWQITAGTGEAYGTEIQISNGDEIESGSTTKKYDFHRFYITGLDTANVVYKVEIYYGTNVFGDSTLLTEFVTACANANQADTHPLAIIAPRITCNNKLWARCKCQTNGATLDFVIGVHTYTA